MPTRIVVANQAQAVFYDTGGPNTPLRLVGRLENPSGRLLDRELKSDRPGRVFASARSGTGRRGAVAHHATGGERSPRRQAVGAFARRIAVDLSAARRAKRFDRLVLVAAPAFMGALRKTLAKSLRAVVAAEIVKDLVGHPKEAVRAHIPQKALVALR